MLKANTNKTERQRIAEITWGLACSGRRGSPKAWGALLAWCWRHDDRKGGKIFFKFCCLGNLNLFETHLLEIIKPL